jgi:hypothetical protein
MRQSLSGEGIMKSDDPAPLFRAATMARRGDPMSYARRGGYDQRYAATFR